MPKWKLFLWKLWHNGLATTYNLHHRGITTSGECPICLHDQEDTQHLFQQCPLALEAWDLGPLKAFISNSQHMSTKDWMYHCLCTLLNNNGATDSDIITYIGTLWAIWKLRNAQVFRQKRPTSTTIAVQLSENMRLHAIFAQQRHDPTRNPLDPSTPPGFDVANIGHYNSGQPEITLQIAGYQHKLKGLGGIAWVASIGHQTSHYQHGTLCYSESLISMVAKACQQACTWAASNNYGHIRILTDSRGLVRILRTGNKGPIAIKWTIDNILRQADAFHTCQVVWVPHQQLAVVRRLAKWWCHSSLSFS